MLTLLFTGILSLTFDIQQVEASGTIYIKADGNIEGTTDISTVDNVTYTFTDNIFNQSIIVERDDIVVDGAGYTLQGTGEGTGISLSGRSNVTIKNTNIQNFSYGISLYNSSFNNSISWNNITENNGNGIHLYSSSNNSISGNNITANSLYGIYLEYSSNNSISGNVFVDEGLTVWYSFGNVVVDNLVNGKPLVYLEGVSDVAVEDAGQVVLVNCTRIRVENLNLSYTDVGVELFHTTNTTISENNITENNGNGIHLYSSSNNSISGNNIANNEDGIRLDYSSNNNSIAGNNIIANNLEGIWLSESSDNNSISGNNIRNNYGGIYLYSSSNNSIYHNNFINNTEQVYSQSSTNVWDNGFPSGGNYWSDYTGVDANMDGVGDSSYEIDLMDIDHYPLMGMFSDFSATLEEETYHVTTVCNSTISAFEFDEVNRIIRFNVTGEEGMGFCRVCIPHALTEPPYTVTVDRQSPLYVNDTLYDNGTHRWIYFTYQHSTHEVEIIPEFPTWTPMLLILTGLTVIIIIYKRRLLKTPIH